MYSSTQAHIRSCLTKNTKNEIPNGAALPSRVRVRTAIKNALKLLTVDNTDNTFLPQHGNYRNLRAYQVTEIIYDLTFYFTRKYLRYPDRTIDQMVQAARSGKQNIAEGNQAAATSAETEIKLTNVAKASLEELLIDYEDYLRVRNLPQWDKGHSRYDAVRRYASSESIKHEYKQYMVRMSDEELANLCITLIHQAIFLLFKLLEKMQDRFVKEGGIKEQMYKARSQYRSGLHYPRPQNSKPAIPQNYQNTQNNQGKTDNQDNESTHAPNGTQANQGNKKMPDSNSTHSEMQPSENQSSQKGQTPQGDCSLQNDHGLQENPNTPSTPIAPKN